MSTCRSAWPAPAGRGQDSGIHHVRGALPARLPGTGAGSTGFKEIIYFLAQLDVKEIHGYNPDLGLSVFTQAALARMEAARNAVATVGAALPAFSTAGRFGFEWHRQRRQCAAGGRRRRVKAGPSPVT